MESGKVVAGKYRLNQLLGSGGMAEVWSATNSFTERQIAIKFMNAQVAKTPEAAARFLKEAKVSARVNHPNIIDIIDVGQTEDGQLFLVMELLTGFPLETGLRRQSPPMTIYEFLLVMTEVAQALAAAHKSGIVHRDLKPTNIFLHKIRDGFAMPKVLDFGVSKFLEDDVNHALTVAGTVLGSPLYMSPEQARGDGQLDGQTDIFAFGAILFEGLCGYRAYEAKNFNALIVKIATTKPKSIDECAPHVPESLRHVVRLCLEPDLKKRAQTLDEVIPLIRAAQVDLEHSALRLPTPVIADHAQDPDATNVLPVMRASDRPPPASSDHMPAAGSIPPPGMSGKMASLPPPGAVPLPTYPSSGNTGPSWHTPNTSYASVTVPTPKPRSRAVIVAAVAALVIGGIALGVGVGWRSRGASNSAAATAELNEHPTTNATAASAVSNGSTESANGTGTASALNAASATSGTAALVATNANALANAPSTGSSAAGSAATPTVAVPSTPTTGTTPANSSELAAVSVESLPGAAQKAASHGSGRLNVTAAPWCTLAVDGKTQGPTPIAGLDLPAGAHQLRCQSASGKTKTTSVTVQEGATAKVKFAFEN